MKMLVNDIILFMSVEVRILYYQPSRHICSKIEIICTLWQPRCCFIAGNSW